MAGENIIIDELPEDLFEKQRAEMVERKGMGHPDSICDGIAESVSRELSREYLKRFDAVLHHNTDQAEVIAGASKPKFGGGEVIAPIYMLVGGRATSRVGEEKIPIHEIARKAMRDYLDRSIINLDVDTHVDIDTRLGDGSADLQDVFKRKKKYPFANDTSFGAGFAPFSETEQLVYNTEVFLNSRSYKKKRPYVGEDIKVMGLRYDSRIRLTIAIAFVDRYLKDFDEYVSVKEEVKQDIQKLASDITDKEVEIGINTADNYKSKSVYITVTGLSAENGDDGSVGRGNRVNGLITPNRTMSMEAAAGKNPVNHVGKLYNILATKVAKNVVDELTGVKTAYVRILSQIGSPVNEPQVLNADLLLNDGYKMSQVEGRARQICESWLDDIPELTNQIIRDEIAVF